MELTTEQIQHTFNVNLYGPIFLVRAALPYMPKGSRIINISSVASKLGSEITGIYGTSKAALDALTFVWAQEASIARRCWMEQTLI
jgi:NAD(P)-dependent dehydrogenase (short-subunit alcohol dehydrogenase family)